ncbi:LysR family transcriptional regulator [Massilia niabensis]|uniref:LysR family transcriptional regulator n=1 Tax=Massilia niabensis TaxID=544910 RepID=A0ABW0L6H0_9BURK
MSGPGRAERPGFEAGPARRAVQDHISSLQTGVSGYRHAPPPAKPAFSCLVNFRHLQALIAVADNCSVTRASEQLCRAQSAVTRSIHALEEALNVELFERKASGMLCNAFGSAVLYRATRAFSEFEAGVSEISGKTRESSRISNVHFPSSLFHESRLEAFVKLAESGHMPTVAKELGVTQPAVSRALNDLESKLGLDLFTRTSKGMLLTVSGERLFFRVKRALLELRQVEADLAALQGTTRGRVVIGALPLGRTSILPLAMTNVLRKHPQLQIATVEGPYESLAARLRAGDIDFIFGALRPADHARDFTSEPLLSDSMAIVVRAGHPLAQVQGLALKDLAALSWVLPNGSTPARKQLDLAFKLEGLPPPLAAVETSDLAILRGVISNTDQVTAISATQLEYEIDAGMLTVLDIALPNTTRVIGITQRADSSASPGASTLIAEIRGIVGRSAPSHDCDALAGRRD